MSFLIILLIISGCVAFQYFKGTLVKSFAAIIIAICASVVAFGYFEVLAKLIINRSENAKLILWAQSLSFILLFILTFAILQTCTLQVIRKPVELELLPERIGRVICGIFLGLIISGSLLTALAIAPLSNKHPYQRFQSKTPNAEKPKRAFLNVDGFVTGFFSHISNGSLSGKRSFATFHPNFLDQVFLNRHEPAADISIITIPDAIELPKKNAAWLAPETIRNTDDTALSPKNGYTLTIVRVGITTKAIKTGGTFTLAQLRLACNKKTIKNRLTGKAKNIYPIGYLRTFDQLQKKQLNDRITIKRSDISGGVKWLDFAFYVPNDFVPVLLEFKQNCVVEIPPLVSSEQVEPTAIFIQQSDCATTSAELKPLSSTKVYGVELGTRSKFLGGLTLKVNDPNQWQNAQTERSIKPAQFEGSKIKYVRAELKQIEIPETDTRQPRGRRTGISTMFEPLEGYILLSLKCNNPSTGSVLKVEQLPVLVEISGLIHQPVGVIASGKVSDQVIYEVDYCSLTSDNIPEGLAIAEDGSVVKPFPDTIWITKEAQSISEFYVLYLVKSGRNTFITSVKPAGSKSIAPFKEYEAFFIK
ncbi:MAG: hypothetical protein ACYS9Y_05890 [Planctomycetota bacterium]|jgi:hypothetical protein